MQIRELSIPDAYEITPTQHVDERGVFLEWYRFDRLEETVGHALELRQANTSVSRRGVLRGIHFADVPPGQAKYVTATRGTVFDVVVDVRVGSPTFGQWDAVVLDEKDRRGIYLGEGLGHAFLALDDHSTVSYLVSDVYRPEAEHSVNPLDPEIGVRFPVEVHESGLSGKDLSAPMLAEAAASAILPTWSAVRSHIDGLRRAQ